MTPITRCLNAKKPPKNYMFLLQELVLKVQGLVRRSGERHQAQEQNWMADYRRYSDEAAGIQKKNGTVGLASSLLHAAGPMFLGKISEAYQSAFKTAIDAVPTLGNYYTTYQQANGERKRAEAAILQTVMTNEGAKSGENQTLIQLLNEALQSARGLFAAASRA